MAQPSPVAPSTTVPVRCQCGLVRGVASEVSPQTGTRIVCMCDDCQAFAHFLGRSDILDRHGGTDIFQLAPAQLTIASGAEQLRCVKLSEKGMLRWYTGCCKTPIGNTMASARVPFIGVIHSFMDHQGDGRSRDEVLGAPLAWLQSRFAIGGAPEGAHDRMPLGLMFRLARQLWRAWRAGRYAPSALFDTHTNTPRVDPQVLTPAERERLRPTGRLGLT